MDGTCVVEQWKNFRLFVSSIASPCVILVITLPLSKNVKLLVTFSGAKSCVVYTLQIISSNISLQLIFWQTLVVDLRFKYSGTLAHRYRS